MIANLLDNAVKYTPKNGEIHIEAWRHGGDTAVMTVRNTGPGITAADLPRIWDRLYRGDQSRSQRGLGLGLSLVKAIVEAHSGRVEAVSQTEKGAVFTVYLPAFDSIPS